MNAYATAGQGDQGSGGGSIAGEWHSTPASDQMCGCGYQAVWIITESGDEVVAKEQPGSKCCFFVPNPFPKTHRMKQAEPGKWEGSLGWKKISLTRVSDTELRHWTTDGPFVLRRA
mmetsp:Transcript_45379/g.113782  ORF Transcript_45379/g.113782 Transcript_45379/m.113782 type:complete len:116 (+) Transcript_45379:122-469(+)